MHKDIKTVKWEIKILSLFVEYRVIYRQLNLQTVRLNKWI